MCENVIKLAMSLHDIKLTPHHPLFSIAQSLQQAILPKQNSPEIEVGCMNIM